MRKLSLPASLTAIALGAFLMPACVPPHTVRFDHATQVQQKAAAGYLYFVANTRGGKRKLFRLCSPTAGCASS